MPQAPRSISAIEIALRLTLGMAAITATLFVPAGTWRFWPGWVYCAVLFVPMIGSTLYFLRHDPALVERRMKIREREPAQRTIIALANLVFIAGFLIPGLDHRFAWSSLPALVVIAANATVLAAYFFVIWVMKTNSFAARTIEVEAGQEVIRSGPYALVRHPMYTGVLVMMLATPAALGSLWALPPLSLMVPLLMWRSVNEEQVLRTELSGYVEYCEQVRWRLLPGLW